MKVYTVQTVPMPDPYWMPEINKRFVQTVDSFVGVVAVHPEMMYTILCFDTVENAEAAAMKLDENSFPVGYNIMNGTISDDMMELTVTSPAKRWKDGGMVQ